MLPVPNKYLAKTEYAQFWDPDYTIPVPNGYFVHNPNFPDRNDAHQLFDFRVVGRGIDKSVFDLFAQNKIQLKLTGHDDESLDCLLCNEHGLEFSFEWMMLLRSESTRRSNDEVTIETVDPGSSRDTELCAQVPQLTRSSYHRSSDKRLGGKIVFAWLNGQPVGTTGWYTVDSFARFRYVKTLQDYRGKGVGTTMINFVQSQSNVEKRRGLVMFCDDEKTISLYEKLGFIRNGFFWKAIRPRSRAKECDHERRS